MAAIAKSWKVGKGPGLASKATAPAPDVQAHAITHFDLSLSLEMPLATGAPNAAGTSCSPMTSWSSGDGRWSGLETGELNTPNAPEYENRPSSNPANSDSTD